MEIKTILKEVTSTIIVEKSKFIAFLFPLDSKKQIEAKLDELRSKYFDATHVCYGYIVYDNEMTLYKSSDDGEPSQTAGAPILNVLKRNNLMNVLCVVVRYFGGIKLGAGGLTRTYSNAAVAALNEASIVTLVDAYKYQVIFAYDRIKDIDKILLLNQIEIIDKIYDMEVCYEVLIYDKSIIEELEKKVSYLNVKIVEKEIVQTRKKI